MIHCKDCAHWAIGGIDKRDGTAQCAYMENDHGKQKMVMIIGYEWDQVWTAPEFGCVAGEARPVVIDSDRLSTEQKAICSGQAISTDAA